ncbi:MAG: hypothetical protein NVS3B13_39070 [Mucilaginibacter sp.]
MVKNPIITASAITEDSLNWRRLKNINKPKIIMVTVDDSHTLLNIHVVTTNKTTETIMNVKSPLENEKRIIKEKHTTIAGPISPIIKNKKSVANVQINADEKKDQRFL